MPMWRYLAVHASAGKRLHSLSVVASADAAEIEGGKLAPDTSEGSDLPTRD